MKRDADAVGRRPAVPPEHAGRKLNWATLVVAVLGHRLPGGRPDEPGAAASSSAPELTAAFQRRSSAAGPGVLDASIAVLPFTDLSPGADQEYFSDGMAEEILNALVRVQTDSRSRRAPPRSASGARRAWAFPRSPNACQVRHVLEGSVRRAGNNLRITAQLIDARVDRHLWSDTFDRPADRGERVRHPGGDRLGDRRRAGRFARYRDRGRGPAGTADREPDGLRHVPARTRPVPGPQRS
jgi:adenylate cyclase